MSDAWFDEDDYMEKEFSEPETFEQSVAFVKMIVGLYGAKINVEIPEGDSVMMTLTGGYKIYQVLGDGGANLWVVESDLGFTFHSESLSEILMAFWQNIVFDSIKEVAGGKLWE